MSHACGTVGIEVVMPQNVYIFIARIFPSPPAAPSRHWSHQLLPLHSLIAITRAFLCGVDDDDLG